MTPLASTVICTTIIIHAGIHLIGVAKAFHGLNIFKLKKKIGTIPMRIYLPGVVWLFCSLILCYSGIQLLSGKHNWWQTLFTGIILSQSLIITSWKSARAGTIVNTILLVIIAFTYSDQKFSKKVNTDISRILSKVDYNNTSVDTNRLNSLPDVVRKWVINSGASKHHINAVHLAQKGFMRTSANGKWIPSVAEQYFTITQPAFVWRVKTQMNSFISFSGRDKLENGKGNMLIKLYAMLPIVNATGKEIDQGTLLRYLGEMCWFPSAALEPYITWEPISSNAAKATIKAGKLTASGIFSFNNKGDIISFEALRYMSADNKTSLEKWFIPITAWKEMDGIRIPVEGQVIWKLKTGDFSYYKWEISGIEYY